VCHAKTTPIFDSENRRRFSIPIRTCSISRSIFGSTWSIETVVIGWSSLFSFGLFVNSAESVNKHFDYIFSYFCYALQLYECIIAAVTASLFFGHVCFRSRKSTPIFEVENRRRFSTPCVISLSDGVGKGRERGNVGRERRKEGRRKGGEEPALPIKINPRPCG